MQLEQLIQPAQPLVPYPVEERGILAPKEGLEPKKKVELKEQGYDDFLNGLCDQIDKECDERAEIRARRYTRNHNYWWGGERRWMYWTKDGYKSLDRKSIKRLFSNNQFFDKVRTLLGVLIRSHPRLNVSPAPSVSENEEKVSAAKVATRTLQHDQREKLSAEFAIIEWLNKLLFGFAVRGQWYAKEGSTAKARVPIIHEEEQQLPGMYVCSQCGMTGPEDRIQNDSCPHCQGDVDLFEGESISVPVHQGYEEIEDGECLTYSISPYEFDLAPEARDIASSPYARWQRKVRTSKLKRAYPKLDLKDLSSTDIPIMLRAQESTKKNKQGEETKKAFTVLKTYWIGVDDIFEFASSKAYQCVSGYELPVGTVLSDVCPQGLRLDRCDKKIIDVRPEAKEDCLSMSAFHPDPLSWEAKGLDDSAELQRWIDDIWTLYLQIQLREALGLITYDKDMFSQGKFSAEIGSPVGVDVPNDGSGRKLNDAVDFKSGNQPNQSIFNGLEYASQSQTNVTGAFPSLSGSNMESSETARGRIILREQSLQGIGPQLFLAARHDVVWAKQNLKLKKKYWVSDRYVPYLEEGEPQGGRYFSAVDIDTEFVIDIEADSWMPLTRLDQIDNMTTYIGGEDALSRIPGGYANTEIIPKAIRTKAAELLNVPSGTDPDEKDLRVARHRYSILKRAVEKITEQGSQPDDKMDQEIPPEINSPLLVPPQMAIQIARMPSLIPLPDIDNHEVLGEFYSDCIKDAIDSDGIENHPLTKAVLMLLRKAHKNQGVMDFQEDQIMEIEANAPSIQTQQEQEAQNADQQHGQEMEKTEAGQAHELKKQKQSSQMKQEEIKTKAKADTKSKSELAKVKV